MMDTFEKRLLGITAVAVVLIVALVVWAFFQPSCAERGGRLEFAGTGLVMAGKVPVITNQYRCVVPGVRP